MRKLITILALFSTFSPSWGQKIIIVEQNANFTMEEKQGEFYYIEKAFPLTNDRWIATLEGFCTNTKKSTLEDLFFDFLETANTLGANAFFIDDFSNAPDTTFVTISVFNLTENELDANYKLYPYNMIYLFGDMLRPHAVVKGTKIKLNSEKIILQPLEYYAYQNAVGKKAGISIGGFFGTKYVLTGKENKLPVYLSFGGLRAAPAVGIGGGIGLNFNTGSIHPFPMNFGQFLVEILEREQTTNNNF
ncbi:MAG: hypothetical protein LBT50_00745 [Prevotellaceae bacterium]|jgi:hypothetical protein|nr:hypothetical protein [Prevotellaceae bacterium]